MPFLLDVHAQYGVAGHTHSIVNVITEQRVVSEDSRAMLMLRYSKVELEKTIHFWITWYDSVFCCYLVQYGVQPVA